jgi:hypothetical protein
MKHWCKKNGTEWLIAIQLVGEHEVDKKIIFPPPGPNYT